MSVLAWLAGTGCLAFILAALGVAGTQVIPEIIRRHRLARYVARQDKPPERKE